MMHSEIGNFSGLSKWQKNFSKVEPQFRQVKARNSPTFPIDFFIVIHPMSVGFEIGPALRSIFVSDLETPLRSSSILTTRNLLVCPCIELSA
jgi:hypothetical protein